MRLTASAFRLRHVAFRPASWLRNLRSRRRRTSCSSWRFRGRSPPFWSRRGSRGTVARFRARNRFTALARRSRLLTRRPRRRRLGRFRFRIASQDIRHRSLRRRRRRRSSSRSSRRRATLLLLSTTTLSSLLSLRRLFRRSPRARRRRRRRRRRSRRRLLSRGCRRLVESHVSTFLVATIVGGGGVSYRSVVPSRRRFASGVISSVRASVSSRSSVLSRSSAVSVVMPVVSVRLLRASLCDEKMVNDDD